MMQSAFHGAGRGGAAGFARGGGKNPSPDVEDSPLLRRRLELGPWDTANSKAGLHTTAMPFLNERRIAAFGADGDGEAVPSRCEGVLYPIHTIGMNAMGLHFMDSLQFEDLSRVCEAERRWEFLVVIAPLRLVAGTGSPVNPIALF